jgi:predicted transport protein
MFGFNGGDDIIVEVDGSNFNQQDYNIIQQLNDIIKDTNQIGEYKIGNLKITINSLNEYQQDLIYI